MICNNQVSLPMTYIQNKTFQGMALEQVPVPSVLDNRMFGSLEDGDIEEAINCAEVIGDDYLQKKARGYAVPESFNHGTSKQRMKWFKKGLETGDVSQGNTFQCSDAEL